MKGDGRDGCGTTAVEQGQWLSEDIVQNSGEENDNQSIKKGQRTTLKVAEKCNGGGG